MVKRTGENEGRGDGGGEGTALTGSPTLLNPTLSWDHCVPWASIRLFGHTHARMHTHTHARHV